MTPADVQRVAQTYLKRDNRTVGWLLPSANGGGGAKEAEDVIDVEFEEKK